MGKHGRKKIKNPTLDSEELSLDSLAQTGGIVMFDGQLAKVERMTGETGTYLLRFGGELYAHGPKKGTARVENGFLVAIKDVGASKFSPLKTPEPISGHIHRYAAA